MEIDRKTLTEELRHYLRIFRQPLGPDVQLVTVVVQDEKASSEALFRVQELLENFVHSTHTDLEALANLAFEVGQSAEERRELEEQSA